MEASRFTRGARGKTPRCNHVYSGGGIVQVLFLHTYKCVEIVGRLPSLCRTHPMLPKEKVPRLHNALSCLEVLLVFRVLELDDRRSLDRAGLEEVEAFAALRRIVSIR